MIIRLHDVLNSQFFSNINFNARCFITTLKKRSKKLKKTDQPRFAPLKFKLILPSNVHRINCQPRSEKLNLLSLCSVYFRIQVYQELAFCYLYKTFVNSEISMRAFVLYWCLSAEITPIWEIGGKDNDDFQMLKLKNSQRRTQNFINFIKDGTFAKNDSSFTEGFQVVCFFDLNFRSIFLDLIWNKKLWYLKGMREFLEQKMIYLSVLGGAYSSLGKSNLRHARKAGELARMMSVIALKMGAENIYHRCELYYSESLIQLGYFKAAQYLISKEFVVALENSDGLLQSICESAQNKLDTARLLLKSHHV